MKNLMKKLAALLCALALVFTAAALPAAAEEEIDVTELYKKRDVEAAWDEDEAIAVTLSGNAFEAPAGAAVTAEGSVLTISAEGTYLLSGVWNGQIRVDVDDEEKVRLILNGVTVESADGPALWELCADKLILTLAEGTVNTFIDHTAGSLEGDEIAAAIWAEDDLSINGSGSLQVTGSVKHGILSRADLIIAGGAISVTAEKDAIRGRNSVLILDGEITAVSGGDGITSTRTAKDDKGWIVIAGGTIRITAGGGAGEAASAVNNGWGRGWGDWGQSASTADGVSSKGIKAETSLSILGGEITIDSLDDALHADSVSVSGGTLSMATGDDGIHADTSLTIAGGTVSVTRSCEGLEGRYITIAGGDISVTASDDGVNATEGGTDNSGWGGMFAAQDCSVTISGGNLYVNAGGDGLDSNGSIRISGGFTRVEGPTDSGNASVDYNGSCEVTGGTLIATGAAGMMQNVSACSGQAALLAAFSGTAGAGSEVVVTKQDGTTVASFTAAKSFQSVLITCPELQQGDTVTVTVNGTSVYSGALTSTVNGNGGGMGGFGGGRGGQQGPGGNPWGERQGPGGRGR